MSIIKLKPSCKEYLWGGRRLIDSFNKHYDGKILAETWELSCHKDGPSFIESNDGSNGMSLPEYIKTKGSAILGDNCKGFDDFPILIKFIDARDNLSIQVHPDNNYAKKNEGQFGKTEMWYVVDAKEGAFLYYGFDEEISKEEFQKRIADDTLLEVLHATPVKKGDVFFIEAGTIHAIGKYIVIAEIQQNSNVTYRVYDYGRVGADGKKRELHIQKAVDVTNIAKPKSYDFNGHLGLCDYFMVDKVDVKSDCPYKSSADATSFVHLLILEGQGTVKGCGQEITVQKGDSIFIEASSGTFEVTGSLEFLSTKVPKLDKTYRVGIDIGGTFCKLGILDNNNNIIAKSQVETQSTRPYKEVIESIAKATEDLICDSGIDKSLFTGIGVGMPGLVDVNDGMVLYSNNIGWSNVPLGPMLHELLGLRVEIANDADCAALGEVVAGSGKGYKSALMITLGTGFGTGVILNGKVYTGSGIGSCEGGHSLLYVDGEKCTCGQNGCIEAYVSASALIKFAKRATGKELNGKEIFDGAKAGDTKLQDVVDKYIHDLGLSVCNLVNIYNPSVVLLSGGVSKQGKVLTDPIEKMLEFHVFGGAHKKLPKVVIASLGYDAGMIGAANLI